MEMGFEEDEEDEDDKEEEEKYLDVEEQRGKLSIWIQESRTRSWIKRKFRKFLFSFKSKGEEEYSYKLAIQEMCKKNRQSLEVNFEDLTNFHQTLALWVAEEP